jgi:hypothetical protein
MERAELVGVAKAMVAGPEIDGVVDMFWAISSVEQEKEEEARRKEKGKGKGKERASAGSEDGEEETVAMGPRRKELRQAKETKETKRRKGTCPLKRKSEEAIPEEKRMRPRYRKAWMQSSSMSDRSSQLQTLWT